MRKRKLRRLLSSVLLCALMSVVTLPNTVAQGGNNSVEANNERIAELRREADEIQRRNQQREQEIAALKDGVENQQKLMNAVNTQIEEINAQIDAYMNLINAKQKSIDLTLIEINDREHIILNAESRISQKQREIERLDEENRQNIEKFGQIAATMYMNSESSAFGLLTGSTTFYDVLVRTEMIRNIGETNAVFTEELLAAIKSQEEAISELSVAIEDLEGEKLVFLDQQRALQREMDALEEEKSAVSAEVNRQYNTLLELTAERDDLQESVAGLKKQSEDEQVAYDGVMQDIADLEAQNRAIESAIRDAQSANPNREVFSSSGFIHPLESRFPITGGFGWDPWRNGVHTGVDFGTPGVGGTSVYVVQSGTVIKQTEGGGWNGGYGNYVVVDHGGGISTLYAHMRTDSVAVRVGQFVTQGQVVGLVGTTGFSTGDHLHFEVRVNGTAVNPAGYLS